MLRCLSVLSLFVLSFPSCYAQISMECERYRVLDGQKTDRSIHRFGMDKSRSTIAYQRTPGVQWRLESPAAFKVSWASPDGLRAVGTLIMSGDRELRLFGPVYVVDLDFSRPQARMESFGGSIDLDEVLENPWRVSCRRTN